MNVMEREARYAAHNYNPLPVVLARGRRRCICGTSQAGATST